MRLSNTEIKARNVKSSLAEKIVTGLTIIVLLSGFAVGGYASSALDETLFGAKIPYYRFSLRSHQVGRHIVRHKSATALASATSRRNGPLSDAPYDISIKPSVASLPAEHPDNSAMRAADAREQFARDVRSFGAPEQVRLRVLNTIARNLISDHQSGEKSLATGRLLALRTSMNRSKPGTMVPSVIVDRRGGTLR
jgi:hypothetical protein